MASMAGDKVTNYTPFPEDRFEEIVIEVMRWLAEASTDDRERFLGCTKDGLVQYHHSLGRNIRNRFGLWKHKWEPEVRDGVDHSPEHADAISQRIIEEVWRRKKQVSEDG